VVVGVVAGIERHSAAAEATATHASDFPSGALPRRLRRSNGRFDRDTSI
jgi:hypothetical protein